MPRGSVQRARGKASKSHTKVETKVTDQPRPMPRAPTVRGHSNEHANRDDATSRSALEYPKRLLARRAAQRAEWLPRAQKKHPRARLTERQVATRDKGVRALGLAANNTLFVVLRRACRYGKRRRRLTCLQSILPRLPHLPCPCCMCCLCCLCCAICFGRLLRCLRYLIPPGLPSPPPPPPPPLPPPPPPGSLS